MHESMFSYNISRPYPYRWFTWVVFAGGVVATVLFSIVNIAADGYDMELIYTSNTTEIEFSDKAAWYQRRPWSLASKAASNCSAQMINVGGSYYTNNYVFPYTIHDIHDVLGNQTRSAVTLAYKNSPLSNCTLHYLTLDMGKLPSNGYINVLVYASCSMLQAEASPTVFLRAEFVLDIGVDLNEVQSIADAVTRTAALDSTALNFLPISLSPTFGTSPSLYWGKRLMHSYTWPLYSAAGSLNFNGSVQWTFYNESQAIWMSASNGGGANMYFGFYNYMSLTEWSNASIIDSIGNGLLAYWDDPITNAHSKTLTNFSDPYAALAAYMDGLSKTVYWTILTDLGQFEYNMLADPNGLMHYYDATLRYKDTAPDDDSNFAGSFNLTINGSDLNATSDNTTDFYQQAGTGIPSVEPAVFAQQYLCQVPRLKTPGSLLVTVIIADLVFLQVLWKALNWVTTIVLERRRPRSKYCAGCDEVMTRNEEVIEMSERHVRYLDVARPGNNRDHRDGESSSLIAPVHNEHDALEEKPTKNTTTIVSRPVSSESGR